MINFFLESSPLGLKTSLGDFSKEMIYESQSKNNISITYDFKKGKASHIAYMANQLVPKFLNKKQDTLYIVFNVSNQDVAFSYKVTTKEGHTNIKIFEEATAFNLPNNTNTIITPQTPPMSGWEKTKPSYEESYTLKEAVETPSRYGLGYTFPALFKLDNNNGWILIPETGVDSHYPGSRLGESTKEGIYKLEFPQEGENNGIGATYAVQTMPAKIPWRTITLGKTLNPIVESNVAFDLVEPLYKPSMDYKMGRAKWSWIVWQDGSINYDDQVKYIDLAASLNFEYVLIDN